MKLHLSNGETYKLSLEAYINEDDVLIDGSLDYTNLLKYKDIVTIEDNDMGFHDIFTVKEVYEDRVELNRL